MEIIIDSPKYGLHIILIDDEDYEKIYEYQWHVKKRDNIFYAYSTIWDKKNKKFISIIMHRLIFGLTDSKIQIDHINHNGLDNRKENLRICSNQQNQYNQRPQRNTISKYKGVSKNGKYFSASIKTKLIGYFDKEEDAARAYNIKAKELFGEFAYLNDIDNWKDFDIEKNKRYKSSSSKYHSVSWDEKNKKWYAYIHHNGKMKNLGRFDTELEAALAYNKAALELKGDKAKLNKIEETDK